MTMKRYFLMMLVSALVVAGCGEDDPVEITEDFDPTQGTPREVMRLFQLAMELKEFDTYRHLLHPDFTLQLQQGTRDQFPDLGPSLDRERDLRCMERMFSGDDLTDPNDEFVPGVIDISFGKLQAVEDWQGVPVGHTGEADVWAPWDVEFITNRGQGHSQLACGGRLEFFMTATDTTTNGTDWQYWRISGIVDKTVLSKWSADRITYGSLKALYR